MTPITTPTRAELDARISRFSGLKPMSTRTNELANVPQEAIDLVFARTILPVILDNTKNPFGNTAPIIGAARSTMFISILPPGQGACMHSHNETFETFMVLEGSVEYLIGDLVAHTVTPNKWDAFSCPPRVYRGFRNVGTGDAVQLTVITGLTEGRDDASVPDSVRQTLRSRFGDAAADAFNPLFAWDPPAGKA